MAWWQASPPTDKEELIAWLAWEDDGGPPDPADARKESKSDKARRDGRFRDAAD
jgi:hypothetical protein